MENNGFWHRKKVFITGHTGFKGSWLTLWLTSLGAQVTGYSLDPPSAPYLFDQAQLDPKCRSVKGDITDFPKLLQTMTNHQPDIVFHLAAQPLVRHSYKEPMHTFHTNVLGTVHMLEAARQTGSVQVIINVTSDKCYKNDGNSHHYFSESDPLGGHDPYSASKACAELVTASYQKSFFERDPYSYPRLASVRAGNVIGGGDWAQDRLIPDLVRAYLGSKKLSIRNPNAIRPWQHVLDPLHGYLLLAEKLWDNPRYAEAWNFGPAGPSLLTVNEIINTAAELWDESLEIDRHPTMAAYESPVLALDSSKSIQALGWHPKLPVKESVEWTVKWYKEYQSGSNMALFTQQQVDAFINL